MASLMSLPVELITNVVSHVPERNCLATLRLTNQILNTIATPYFFAAVPLYPEWSEDSEHDPPFPNQIEYEAFYFRNILEDERLSKLIKKVEIYTCNPDCDHHPRWVHCGGDLNLYEGWMPRPRMSNEWMDVYNALPELPNLDSISLHFDRHAGAEDNYCGDEEFQGPLERISNVDNVFQLLKGRIRNLSIRNIQLHSWMPHSVTGLGGILSIEQACVWDRALALKNSTLEKLDSLRMNVVHLEPHGEAGPVYKVTDCHEQWAAFPSFWLSPASNLRHLTIYSDIPVGWFPKVDLRSVHFTQLETLSLGHFVFSHDHQIDWILGHASTLQELYLDQCSILYQHGFGKRRNECVDGEGYPATKPPVYSLDYDKASLYLGSYATRWCDVFSLFSTSLHRLRTFRFGTSSQWDFDTENRYDDAGPGMPVMPWEGERDLEQQLFEKRYLVWDDWSNEYVSCWRDGSAEQDCLLATLGDDDARRFEEYPTCTSEDERQLRELLKKLGSVDGGRIRVQEVVTW